MRPPEFTGGNPENSARNKQYQRGFNEAAGIHRRKQVTALLRLTPTPKPLQ